ncbi:immunoglobulin-like domain-containing protein [Hyalangium rubrum]|uniref:DUF5011 domain-containing protein n=1 Tax=Hyalangium rubrum TaxID=3103134 RepID=A0ABU5H875_9BACT|nr:immunoglobulin-like domain-containing protein [Hyalangium sp. s54d21]MDY7229079.1 DUF5011 domain-containing protein [Hyalangium sp. s54d21]
MKLKGVWGASLVMVALAASSCDEEQSAPQPEPTPANVRTTRQEARSERKVLILGSSGEGSLEAFAAENSSNGTMAVEIVDADGWREKTAEQFMTYRALIIGDAACQAGEEAFQAAIETRAKWGAIVDGPVVIFGTNPASNNISDMVTSSVNFVTSGGVRTTGMYISLGCAYQDAAPNTAVTLLEPFGSFTVAGVPCSETGHAIAMAPFDNNPMMNVGNWLLGGDSACVARSVFTSYPERNFAIAALAVDTDGSMPGSWPYFDYDAGEGIAGTPYILARGAMARSLGCGNPDYMPSGEECDLGDGVNGQRATNFPASREDTCSWSCKYDWCGDGIVNAGEECDLGFGNGRDISGNLGTCTASCKFPNIPNESHPPVAVCRNVTVGAGSACGAYADINNGSYDEDGDLEDGNCSQDPMPVYGLGQTVVTLTCTDNSGQSSSCTGTVTVTDDQAPTLALSGSSNQSLECGSAYSDPGATANDACPEMDLTGAIVVTGAVNPNTPASYTVRYNVQDEAGNSAPEVTRTVAVSDTLKPVITLNGAANQGLECGTAYAEPGATANDQCAGTLTPTIAGSVNHMAPNSYIVRYNVTDPTGHAADEKSRVVTVSDTLAPVVTMTGPGTIPVECGDGSYADPGATANDACAGVLPAVANGTANPNQPGSTTITYSATDPSGNTGVAAGSRTVVVSDTLAPVLTVRPGPSNVECASEYNDPGATANDQCAGDLTASIVTTGAVNAQQPATYQVGYTVTDPAGRTASAERVVDVTDTIAPTVTMVGPSTLPVECGATDYADPGATANDACAGTLPAVPSRVANPGQTGSTTITYSATDPSGNTGTSAGSRTVVVSDTLAPVLSLNGAATQNLECATAYTEQGATANDQCDGPLTPVISGSVNNMAPAPYTLTYTATDDEGHVATANRQVTVRDTLAPAVTMVGASAIAVECGDGSYADPGATANDACAGALPAVPSRVVNPGVPGSSTITYSATDPSGNTGTAAGGRVVTVSDTLAPTLTLRPGPSNVECASPYNDPGATANDLCAGDLTGAIVTTGGVNTGTPGNYELGYSVSDGQGHTVTATRPVGVSDSLPPSITVNGPTNDAFECGSTYVDPGATANDLCAGNVTVVAQQSGNPSQPGSFTITYSATDPAGNSVTSPVVRTVTVDDNEPPTLVLLGNATQSLECGNPYADPGATANDVCFGDVTSRITVTGTVNTGAPGSYPLTYNVTDPSGQSAPAVNRTVNVSDTLAPVVTVTGPLSQQIECGNGPYADPGATANDACAGALPAVPSTVVDPNAPQDYVIRYTATDPSGNTGTSATGRTVTVADTLPPTLALTGPANQTLECKTPFNDPGATANDLCAGNISARIVRTGTVDPTVIDVPYTLTYNVTDPSGRSAPAVTRTVTYDDTLAPSLTLQGPLNDTYACGSNYIDPGATAEDACAGNVTNRITVAQTGNPSQPGVITYTYSVTDPSGNSYTSPVTRSVTVNDNEPPVLVLNGSATQGLECGTPFVDPLATANDVCFGDVTSRITVSGTVNHMVPAPYTLTYNVTDQAGQSAPAVNRTVNVSDTLAPSITVLGPLNQQFECGNGPYADPGATASDVCAGDLTGAIVRTGSVNTGAGGTYTLSYRVADPSGNQTTAAESRTVTVTDSSAPVIALNGAATVGLECGSPYNELGATANDACVGNLTVQISGVVNPNQGGSYTITYSASDGVQSAQVQRTVNVSDELPPTLSLVGPATQLVECNSAYVDPGAEANDLCEGDLTARIVRSGTVDPAVLNTYTVTYNVSDVGGNAAAPVNRAVTVRDTLAPAITVNGPADQVHECGSAYVDPGASATDQCAGNVTVVAQQSGNPSAPGTSFTITYSATDPSGNSVTSPVVRTVTVNDNAPPTLALNGPATQNLECGSPYNDPGAMANDACFGDLTGSITVSGTVNTGVPGSYPVVYNVVDPAGQAAPSLSRTVNVSDTLAPTITVQGPVNDTFECGTSYVDPGATASDVCAGNLTPVIVATQTPDPSQPGAIRITYSVTDPSGNQTVSPVVRTVRVNDNTPPTITLNGPSNQVMECGSPYEDPGATATDLCTAGPVPVTVTGTVDHTTAGTYPLRYTAQDTVGNISPTVTRFVTVLDTLGPTISLNGPNPTFLECKGNAYEELGGTANDICSGARPVTVVSNNVNLEVPGGYLVNYQASDSSGNTTPASRNVIVQDNEGPTLTMSVEDVTLECAISTFTDPTGTATDQCQGNVSSTIFREFTDLNINVEGDYIARYQARDNVGHLAFDTINLHVQDTTAPTIIANNDGETIECGTQPALGVTATDACYPNGVTITATPSSLPSVPGQYTVTYTATDTAGNTSTVPVTRTITVEDTGVPELSLEDQNIYYECTGHAIGNIWEAPVATATDTCEGSIPVHQYNTGDDDEDGLPGGPGGDPDDFGPGPTTEVEGLYYVQYLAWDEAYNTDSAILSVYVTDTLKPVLGLVGSDTEQVECFLPTDNPNDPDEDPEEDPNPYVDQGAWAEDQCYGDLSAAVLRFGEVNKQIPGTYTLQYQVRDGAYNWADPVSRTVEVVDTFQPEVTVKPTIRLTPADNTMRTMQLSECTFAWDVCEGYMDINSLGLITDITSNQPATDADDIIIVDNSKFTLKAKTQPGQTRVYTVNFLVGDSSGNTTSAACTVSVPSNGIVAPTTVKGEGTLAKR